MNKVEKNNADDKQLVRLSRLPKLSIADRVALIILFLLPFLVYFPVTSGQATFAGFDHTGINQPLKQAAYETLRSGQFPHWEPRLDRGLPLLAEGEAGIFYPLNVLFFLPVDFLTVYNIVLLLCIVLGGVLFYWWMRRLGTGPLAAFLAGVAHQWGSTVNFNKANMNILEGYILTPLLLIVVEPEAWSESLKKNYPVRGACIGLVFASLLFAGQAQYVVYAVLFTFVYIIMRVIFSGKSGWKAVLSSMGIPYVIGGILALGLSAVQLLPTMELIGLSERSSGVINEGFFTHGLWLNPSRLFATFIFPAYHYSLDHFLPYLSTTVYVGPVAIMLAGYAIRYRIDLPDKSRRIIFPLIISGLIFLHLAMGANAPLGELFTSQGLLAQFRGHGRLGGYFALTVLTLMGFGLDTLLKRPVVDSCDMTGSRWCIPLFTYQLIGMGLLAIPFVVQREEYILTRISLLIFIGMISILIMGYLVGNLLRTRIPVAVAVGIILAGQIFGFMATSSETLIKRENWDVARADLIYIRDNSDSPNEASIFAIRTQASVRIHERILRDGLNAFIPGAHDHIDHLGSANACLMEDLTVCNADLPLELARWENLVHRNLWLEADFTDGQLPDKWANLLWVLGVNWIVTENPDLVVPGMVKLENNDWNNRGIPFFIYERESETRPHTIYWDWWTIPSGLPEDEIQAEFYTYLENANVGSKVFIEGVDEPHEIDEDEFWSQNRSSTVTNAGWISPVEYKAIVEVSEDAIFMFRDQYYPGWEVYVDDQEAELFKADMVFKAVMLPAGRSEVVFKFTPTQFIRGGIVSIVSLVLILIILGWYLNTLPIRLGKPDEPRLNGK